MGELNSSSGSVKNSKNSNSHLIDAINSGKVNFYRGHFKGSFNAKISKDLRSLGAVYDRSNKSYKILLSKLPKEVKQSILSSTNLLSKKLTRLDRKIKSLKSKNIVKGLDFRSIFKNLIEDSDADTDTKLKNISVKFSLKKESLKNLETEYATNMKKDIKGWFDHEVLMLRKQVKRFQKKGIRAEELKGYILRRYSVSESKAKFLARQETRLVMSKYREQKMKEAGSKKYKWQTVAGSKKHPVRPAHKKLNNKIFSWDKPPITSDTGQRRNHIITTATPNHPIFTRQGFKASNSLNNSR